MTLASALSSALSGLSVTTQQLQLTANNIANAQQDGYSAKRAIVSSVAFGSTAGGATITGFTRASDDALFKAYNASTAQSSYLGTQSGYLKQVQTILNSTSTNPALSNAIAQFQSAWTQYSAAPENASQQQAVLLAGTNLAAEVRNIASATLSLNRQVTNSITSSVETLNTALDKVALLNEQIAVATTSGQPSGDLQDERDKTITEISRLTAVNTVARDSNQIAIYTPGGVLLLDSQSALTFSFDGTNITSSTGQVVTNALKGGSLEASLQFVYDGSPAAVSSSPASEVIRKINSQLEALTNAFTDATAGSPATFANAYNNAATGSGELAAGFFSVTGGDPTTLVVNANLLSGASTLKLASGSVVVTALNAARSFTADGLSVASGTYADLGSAILSGFQQAANSVSAQNDPAQQQQTFYKQALANATGVNVDTELVYLTTLQNSYAASAHVISTINQMLQTLDGIF